MAQTFLDECFKARMDYLRERFPLEDFRKKFKEEYTRRGMVMMQDKPVNMLNSCGMVLDPFMGTATTAVAAIKKHRHYVGFELNKDYFDIAKNRINEVLAQPTLFD